MSLQSFKEKLKNLKGQYTFNFANEDDCEYLLEEYGGEERMKTKYPTVYASYLKAKNSSCNYRESTGESEKKIATGRIDRFEIEMLSSNMESTGNSDPIARLSTNLICKFIDPTTAIESDTAAKKWKGVSMTITTKDDSSPYNLMKVSKFLPLANSYAGTLCTNAKKHSDLTNKSYTTTIDVNGTTSDGALQKTQFQESVELGTVESYAIQDIIINDPAPKNDKHRQSNEIMMLYGRENQQSIFEDADYKGEDYLNNAFDTTTNKVHLLLPMSGKIVYNYNYEPKGLVEPVGFRLPRAEVTYDYKDQVFSYRSDLTDELLYKKLTDRFTPESYGSSRTTALNFDVKIPDGTRSVYDWHADVLGVANGTAKTIFLTGRFLCYSINHFAELDAEDEIIIESITKSDLERINREYYKYKEGTNTIYIPPIDVYWGCFSKDVNIMLADKTEKCASEVKIGDKLLGYDNQIVTVDNVLTGTDVTIYLIKTKDKGEIKVSGGHPMMCEGERVRAKQIKIGDKLNLANGSLAEVENVEIVEYNDTVYNFTFEGIEEGVYIIANGFYSGDLRMQNEKTEQPEEIFTNEDKMLIAEMSLHHEEMKSKNME